MATEIRGVTKESLAVYLAAMQNADRIRQAEGLPTVRDSFEMIKVPFAKAGRRYGKHLAVPGGGPGVVHKGRIMSSGQVATPGDWGSRARKAAGYKLPWHAQLAWNKRDPNVSPRELADRQETPHWGFNMGRAMRSHRNAFRPSFNTAPSWATSLAKKRRGYYRPMGVR